MIRTVRVMPKTSADEAKRPGTAAHKLGPKTTPLEYEPIDWKSYSIRQRLLGALMGIVRMFPNLASLNNRSIETKDRLKTFLSTIGLISALLLTMTYPSCLNPLSLHIKKYTTTDDTIRPWCSEVTMVKTLRASNTLGNISFI